jgi:acetyl esterase/lipase
MQGSEAVGFSKPRPCGCCRHRRFDWSTQSRGGRSVIASPQSKTWQSAAFAVATIADQPYATVSGRQLLADLYLPRGISAPVPVIVWLHGGGFRIGDRKLAPDLSRFFARRGFAMVSVDYRLSGQAIFPAAIEDVKAALRWVRAIADQYGLDPERVGLWGSSAGGYLAAMAATTPSELFAGREPAQGIAPARILAVVDGYAPIDFLQIDAYLSPGEVRSGDPETASIPIGERAADSDSRLSLFLGAPIETVPEQVRRANPISYVTGAEPAFLILHGLCDSAIPAHQSELLFAALAAADNEVTLILIEGLGHAFFNRSDLDDAGKHFAHIRTTSSAAQPRSAEIAIFETIEHFFALHLGRGA